MVSTFLHIASLMGQPLVFRKGPAMVSDGKTTAMRFDTYCNKVLLPQIASGIIEERDLKLRFSGFAENGHEEIIFAGPTSFQEYRQAFSGQEPDLGKIAGLKERGKKAGNEWAMLSRPIGLTAIVLDSTDAYLVGERKPSSAGKGVTEYSSFWHSPAGYLPFTTDLSRIDLPGLAVKFVGRDYNISWENIERMTPKLIAAHPDTGETDIALVVRTNLPPNFSLKLNTDKYCSWQRIEKGRAQDFVSRHNVVYSTAAALSQ